MVPDIILLLNIKLIIKYINRQSNINIMFIHTHSRTHARVFYIIIMYIIYYIYNR